MNEPLKKPHKTTARVLFCSASNILTQGEDFIPAWDNTDHLSFVCEHCHTKATILAVEFYPNIGEIGAALYFRLKCPECKNTGQRKIYLETKDAPFQQALDYSNQLLLYARDKQKPVKIVQLYAETSNMPIIKAFPRPEGGFMFWCSHCKKWHRHGKGEGHRTAHCDNKDSPYKRTGYIIKSLTKTEMKKILKGLSPPKTR